MAITVTAGVITAVVDSMVAQPDGNADLIWGTLVGANVGYFGLHCDLLPALRAAHAVSLCPSHNGDAGHYCTTTDLCVCCQGALVGWLADRHQSGEM
ncbi:MAG: hypothetical protein KGL39_31650 [Patescibacteria group bacterium]|nr:hypothetical protein [Patescibacteria group bacterium]